MQALHFTVTLLRGGDALDGVVGTGKRRDVRNLVVDASPQRGDNSTKPLKWQVSYSVRGFGSVIQKCEHFCATLTLHTFDGGLADGAFVLDGVALCPRRVDDEVHLLVQDDVENVRAAFGKTLQARVAGKLACA